MLHFYYVLLAGLLPFVATGIAKSRRFSLEANRAPRAYLENREGYQKRAHWAQLNSFEAFPLFAAGVIVAHLKQVDSQTLNALCVIFVIARALYIVAYVTDRATARSILWTIGVAVSVALYLL